MAVQHLNQGKLLSLCHWSVLELLRFSHDPSVVGTLRLQLYFDFQQIYQINTLTTRLEADQQFNTLTSCPCLTINDEVAALHCSAADCGSFVH